MQIAQFQRRLPGATSLRCTGVGAATFAGGARCVAHHGGDHALLRHVSQRRLGDHTPVAQHGHAAADLVDLLKVVRDVQECDAGGLQMR